MLNPKFHNKLHDPFNSVETLSTQTRVILYMDESGQPVAINVPLADNYILATNLAGSPTFKSLIETKTLDITWLAETSKTISQQSLYTILTGINAYLTSLDVSVNNRLLKDGSQPMLGNLDLNSNRIINVANPLNANDAVNLQYVSSIAVGLKPNANVRVATTANINLASAPSVIDTETLVSGDRVLAWVQTDAKENGVYIFNGVGVAMTRSLDLDNAPTGEILNGIWIPIVLEGAASPAGNLNSSFYISSTGTGLNGVHTLGVDNIIFDLFRPPSSLTEGFGIDIAGSTIAIDSTFVKTNTVGNETLNPISVSYIKLLEDKVAPIKPALLSNTNLDMKTGHKLYSARDKVTGNLTSNVTNSTTPSCEALNFFDGDLGVLSCEIDVVASGNRTLTTGSDVGTYSNLSITADEDPYVGISGQQNWWKQLDAGIVPVSPLSLSVQHSYKLLHSITGNTNLLQFYCDTPLSPSIANISIEPVIGANTRFISGIPSMTTGEFIRVGLQANNIVSNYYSDIKSVALTSTYLTGQDVVLAGANAGPNITFTNKDMPCLTNSYIENIPVNISVYNARASKTANTGSVAGDISTTSGALTSTGVIRIDTKTSETGVRRLAGSGDYPATFGALYSSGDSATLLTAGGNEELLYLNSIYKYPSGNYTTNKPSAGPNYSSVTGYRRACFQTSLTSFSKIAVTINGAINFNDVLMANAKLVVKVTGSTGWVDANVAWSPALPNPNADGEAALDLTNSTTTIKYVTFGTQVLTGTVSAIISLNTGSTRTFTNLTITKVS